MRHKTNEPQLERAGDGPETSVTARPARQLIGLRVLVSGRDAGVIEDLVLAEDLRVALGVVVVLNDGGRGFVPWVALSVQRDTLPRAMTMLGEVELAYYLSRGVRAARLAGLLVTGDDSESAAVQDVLVEPLSGEVAALIVGDRLGLRHVGPSPGNNGFGTRCELELIE